MLNVPKHVTLVSEANEKIEAHKCILNVPTHVTLVSEDNETIETHKFMKKKKNFTSFWLGEVWLGLVIGG